ncbi:MAG TPA: hypothetical protein VK184_25645 [Nostocaceae cyanobacterium]|nr:hypothetical protein [Nostocaceae cyanobacterium]
MTISTEQSTLPTDTTSLNFTDFFNDYNYQIQCNGNRITITLPDSMSNSELLEVHEQVTTLINSHCYYHKHPELEQPLIIC